MLWSAPDESNFEKLQPGTYLARCVRIIDLGTQKGEYQGKPTFKRKNVLAWELPADLIETGDFAGQPFMVSKFYTASLDPKANLRADLESWRGRTFSEAELAGFDPQNIIGKPCMVSIIHNKNNKVNVASVMALPKGMTCPPQINPTLYFSLDDFKEGVFNLVPEYFKKQIMLSPEYQNLFDTTMDEEILLSAPPF